MEVNHLTYSLGSHNIILWASVTRTKRQCCIQVGVIDPIDNVIQKYLKRLSYKSIPRDYHNQVGEWSEKDVEHFWRNFDMTVYKNIIFKDYKKVDLTLTTMANILQMTPFGHRMRFLTFFSKISILSLDFYLFIYA